MVFNVHCKSALVLGVEKSYDCTLICFQVFGTEGSQCGGSPNQTNKLIIS